MPYVTTNGIQLYYEEAGDGPPLICIMGITGPGSVWANHVELWKRSVCVMADNRGVGKSDMPSGPYTSAMMADDYAGLMDAMSIERARHWLLDGQCDRSATHAASPAASPEHRPHVSMGTLRSLRPRRLRTSARGQGQAHRCRVRPLPPVVDIREAVLGQRRQPRNPDGRSTTRRRKKPLPSRFTR